ncbi:hypothetical protein MNAN1_002493 [Malassezia nana]|uniref:TEL2-interacting protein 1 n=1 Tax=Malassezia nana TaxID=180528 RepID=A0AAF0ERL0_9BASI|nr:hypothetical protein MNAN1_002493 [Malassezia nana]
MAGAQEASKAAFQVLRPICVRILELSHGALDASELVGRLQDLHSQLSTLTDPLAPALIHYVFYPLSQLLRARPTGLLALPDRVRELVFLSLTVLARDWWSTWTWAHVQQHSPGARRLEQSSDWKVWEQLLFLGVMALQGGVRSPARPSSDETRLAILHFLAALLRPRHVDPAMGPQGTDWEWDGVSELPLLGEEDVDQRVYPAAQHTAAARDSDAVAGALAHLLKMAMVTARQDKGPVPLRLAALDVASLVALTWMAGSTERPVYGAQEEAPFRRRPVDAGIGAAAERLRPILPGVSSSLVKVITSPASSVIVARALAMLSAMWVLCLHDEATASMRTVLPVETPSLPSCLEDFALWNAASQSTLSAPEEDTDTDTNSEPGSISTARTSVDEGPESWLEQTMPPVRVAIVAISRMADSDEARVQGALAHWAHALLAYSWDTLTWADAEATMDVRHLLIEILVDLAHSGHAQRVVQAARTRLKDLGARALPGMQVVLEQSLHMLPALIRQVQDSSVQRLAHRVTTCASLLSTELLAEQLQAPDTAFLRVLSPEGGVEQWAELGAQALGAYQGAPIVVADGLPHLPPSLTQLEAMSLVAMGRMWNMVGQSLQQLLYEATQKGNVPRFKIAFAVPLHMLHTAVALRADAQWRVSLAHIWAVHELFLGVSDVVSRPNLQTYITQPAGRPLRKTMHSLARHVLLEVQSVWQCEAEKPPESVQTEHDVVSRDTEADTAVLVRGLPSVSEPACDVHAGPALDVSFVPYAKVDGPRAAPDAVQQAQRRLALRDQWDAYLLLLLGSASTWLGVSCRPWLLHILYPVLSALGRHEATVRQAAQYALERIADACAYPTVQSCVLHHTDYILGAASHRLVSGLRLELQAGLAQPSVQLQRSSGALLSARAAPWVLVQVIQMLGAEAVPLVEDSIDEVLAALDHFHGHDDLCDGLLAVVAKLVEVMVPPRSRQPAAVESPNDAALHAFEAWLAGSEDNEGETAGPAAPEEEEPLHEPDRLQSVVAQILARCVPFMSHDSAQIRARALDMLADGICLLAPQACTAELYPVLERAWPRILARLGQSASSAGVAIESDHRVWCRATALVGVLGEYVPDVYGKRIVQDAWPRWQRLLTSLQQTRRPPAARIEGPAVASTALMAQRAVRLLDEHGSLTELLLVVLEALTRFVSAASEKLDSAAVWSFLTYPLFLDTLDERQPRAIRDKGVQLYACLVRADSMAAWMALRAAIGTSPPWELRHDLALSSNVTICFT